MKLLQTLLLFVCALAANLAAQPATGNSLRGVVTDPSGATVPQALVQVRGPGGEQRARTDELGRYAFSSLRPGKYQIRIIAQGFTVAEKRNMEIAGAATFDAQLTIQAEAQVINVEEEANRVTTDPTANGSAIVLGEKELETLSDDPDELQQQLQAMAGPSAGPNGGQIYIDGFTGGNLPPKASIREVRINSNPFSPEYDRPGFGRIEILTRPGTDKIRGQAFIQYNNENLNSRSPLLTQSERPPYEQKFFGVNLSGPIQKQKASFALDAERRGVTDNAFILATTLDPYLNPVSVNQVVVTPQTRTNITPRFDYAINAKNTLVVRYQNTHVSQESEGVGNFNLVSKAFDQKQTEHTVQVTETAVLSANAINELRFQFQRTNLGKTGDNSTPAISVPGAFEGGGAQVGNSGTLNHSWELNNNATLTHSRHSFKAGVRLRQGFTDDTSVYNFGGAYAFFGGTGPLLDSNNQAIAGTSEQLTALERYRRTLLFQNLGYSPELIRALGGGASQFSMAAGMPTTAVNQLDIGLFVNDDWKIRSNLTLSYGLRYETQTNISDFGNWSPRVGIAWGIDGGGGKQAKTVLRAGFGTFYDRIDDNLTLQTRRFDGQTQKSYLILNPDFFPAIPSPALLGGSQQPQQLQFLDPAIVAPRNYQFSAGIERQVNKYFRLTAQYMGSRGVHLLRARNINAPVAGIYPFGDRELRNWYESTGFSRTNQIIVSPSLNYKKLFLFGFYSNGYGKSDAEGQAADSYNLRAEWGPSSFGDIRHRAILGTSLPLPFKFSLSPFMMVSSGAPYNITTGHDTNGDGATAERPSVVSTPASGCSGGNLAYEPGFGCFNLSPAPGTAIERNSGRGPANFNMSLRLARTWGFGSKGEPATGNDGPPSGMGGMRGGPGGGGGGRGPGGMGGMGGRGGPPRGMFGATSGKKYNLTLSVSARNVINHANYSAPSGDLSSPYFGEYRSLAGFGPFGGNSTYNRKIDVQLRFMF